MLLSKKVILSSMLLSIPFLTIFSPVSAGWKNCWCCKNDTVDSPTSRRRTSTSPKSNPIPAEEEKRELIVVPAVPAVQPSSTVEFETPPTILSSAPNPGQEQEQEQEQDVDQPLLASFSTNSSSGSNNFFELVALTSQSSLGLALKSTPALEVEGHKIQETEEGVRIVSTPTGGIIFVFPNTAYVALQPHASRNQVPYPTRRMLTKEASLLMLTKEASLLPNIPETVRGFFASDTRNALKQPSLGSFSKKLYGMILRAISVQGIEVRTYAAQGRSLKEVLITGSEEQLLQIITGTIGETETMSRAFLSQAFRALSNIPEDTGSSSDDE